ncbi:ribosome small subunit-dependent GTPase A [Reinekea marina]|uniref:Small ribosomal subunit biogenesis GTPase RsgA n=1 Tax=Reinekea marina TaxID=1310421 RepID=A0ABV7WUU1_9GAMM|nr:ribosome small subunit-dependent GTPase A [Reinekea marina]MDN3647548.1 ribosome small subunit-dependent GTPase A [Reinekea marina]MDN3651117.1 ribosome small subunit-dependent GTPase A [Reinekea marina]
MNNPNKMSLTDLGWRPILQQQLTLEDLEQGYVARVVSAQRDVIGVLSEQGESLLPLRLFDQKDDPEFRPTVGDWVWVDFEHSRARVFERLSYLKRTAAGSNPKPQSIAANVDTLFLVSSCNKDFNVSKLERYLALALEAKIPTVIVLTKADLTNSVEDYEAQAKSIHVNTPVVVVDALSEEAIDHLKPWLVKGDAIAFVGSSGVGKSTLTNAVLGREAQATQGIRVDDAKGRHTTTDRSMHLSPTGTWVIDTPGMRELRITDVSDGIAEVFDDIEALKLRCKFRNCQHEGDEGCAIQEAIEAGELTMRRWSNYLKLQREADFAASNKWQQREKHRQFGKMINNHLKQKKTLKY